MKKNFIFRIKHVLFLLAILMVLPLTVSARNLIMARAARQKFPYSIECKNQESVNIWKSYEQAESNAGDYEPVLFIKRNNQKPLVVVDADYFVSLHNRVAKEYDMDADRQWLDELL